MNVIEGISIALCGIYLLVQGAYLILLHFNKTALVQELTDYPMISILVAARNEEENILSCMKSLDALEYPEGKIEIILGNDQSTDSTASRMGEYCQGKSKFRLIHLNGTEFPQTKGKARVLACLADAAQGEFFLITDADIEVKPLWAKAMICRMKNEGADLAGGITNIHARSLFEKFQQVDWIYFMGILHSFSFIGKPLTIVGNNMGISRRAYESTGGYGKIPFSITEDYALFKAVQNNGFQISQRPSGESMVYSKPLKTIQAVLKQRKRWLTGGWELPFYYHVMMFVFGSWYFAVPVVLMMNLKVGILFFIFKNMLQYLQLMRIYSLMKQKIEHRLTAIVYDLYLFFMIPLTSIYFLLPMKNTWKGRKY